VFADISLHDNYLSRISTFSKTRLELTCSRDFVVRLLWHTRFSRVFVICDSYAQNQLQVAFLTFWVWCIIWKRNTSSL